MVKRNNQNPACYFNSQSELANMIQTLTRVKLPPYRGPLLHLGHHSTCRPSGQHDELDEQSNKSAGLRAHGCSQALEGCDRSNWHRWLQRARHGHHPWTEIKFNTCEINWLTEKHNWNTSDRRYSFCPRRRITCTHASSKQGSKRLEIQSGQWSGTSTGTRICRSTEDQWGTRSRGHTLCV